MPLNDPVHVRRPPSLLALPSYLAGNAARIGNAHLVAALASHGLRLPQHAVLAALADYGPLAPHELASCLRMDRSHVSAYLESLVRRGWVRRENDPRDRRRRRVVLTDSGAGLARELGTEARRAQADFLRGLSAAERETLIALLAKLVDTADRDQTQADQPRAGLTAVVRVEDVGDPGDAFADRQVGLAGADESVVSRGWWVSFR